jgi:hypothetical protein
MLKELAVRPADMSGMHVGFPRIKWTTLIYISNRLFLAMGGVVAVALSFRPSKF